MPVALLGPYEEEPLFVQEAQQPYAYKELEPLTTVDPLYNDPLYNDPLYKTEAERSVLIFSFDTGMNRCAYALGFIAPFGPY